MKKIISLLLAIVVTFSLTIPAFAVDGQNEDVQVTLDRRIKVTYNGELQTFTDANGKIVSPIVYNGTTYLPVRALSALVELPIAWDGANYAVVMGGDGQFTPAAEPVGTAPTADEAVTATINRQLKVTFNGELQTFKDANGTVVYPITYQGTTYLPIRAAAGLVDIPVEWDGPNYTVVLGTQPEAPPAAKPDVDVRGRWLDGNIYKNEFAGLLFLRPDIYKISSPEDIERMFGEAADEEVYDMMVEKSSSSDLAIAAVSFLSLGELLEDASTLTNDMFARAYANSLKHHGYNVIPNGTDDVDTYMIGDTEYYVVHASEIIQGTTVLWDYYFNVTSEGYVTCITLIGINEDTMDEMIGCFI